MTDTKREARMPLLEPRVLFSDCANGVAAIRPLVQCSVFFPKLNDALRIAGQDGDQEGQRISRLNCPGGVQCIGILGCIEPFQFTFEERHRGKTICLIECLERLASQPLDHM